MGRGVGRCFVMHESLAVCRGRTTGGFINGIHSVHPNPCPSKVKLHPLIWELRNFLLDDFRNSDLELSKLESSPSSSLVEF